MCMRTCMQHALVHTFVHADRRKWYKAWASHRESCFVELLQCFVQRSDTVWAREMHQRLLNYLRGIDVITSAHGLCLFSTREFSYAQIMAIFHAEDGAFTPCKQLMTEAWQCFSSVNAVLTCGDHLFYDFTRAHRRTDGHRQTQTDTDRDRQTRTQTETETETQTDTDTDRDRDRDTDRHRQTQTDTDTDRDRDRDTDRQTDRRTRKDGRTVRETERQTDRLTDRQTDR